jgi:hypothetical protein
VGGEALHTDPPGGSLVPPHMILKVVSLIYLTARYIKSQNIDNYLVWLYKEVV